MLKLSLKPGEYITLGDNIKIIFSGGSANNIHLLVDAPREINVARNSAGKDKKPSPYYKEKGISKTAQREIAEILMREKRNQSHVSGEETCLLYTSRQLLYGDIESVRDAYRMVAGERHALRAFGGRLVYMEETPVGCSALVKHDHAEYDRALKVWEPDTEELMYYLAKGAEHGRGNQI